MKKLIISLLLLAAFLISPPGLVAQARSVNDIVTPGLCRVKTDMELDWVGTIPTNYNSRTRLPGYSHVSGGITPATMRLQGGKGNLQLSAAWIDYIDRLNNRNPIILKYLFHADSGWQNSGQYARVEELAFENQFLTVTRVSGDKAYIQTFYSDQKPPSVTTAENRQEFTVVTRDNNIIGSPKGRAYIVLIAKPGEVLWIYTKYLQCPNTLPKEVSILTYPQNINVRTGPGTQYPITSIYAPGMSVKITQTSGTNPNIWGMTDKGWIALWLTSWGR